VGQSHTTKLTEHFLGGPLCRYDSIARAFFRIKQSAYAFGPTGIQTNAKDTALCRSQECKTACATFAEEKSPFRFNSAVGMSDSDNNVSLLSQKLEQLLAKKAAIANPLDEEILQLSQKIHGLKNSAGVGITHVDEGVVPNDVLVSLIAACASDNVNAFARAGRVLFKANVKLSSLRSDRKLSLLHTAARFGSVKITGQLLESEPNLLNILDDLGRDALMISVFYRQLHVFHILARNSDSSFAHQSLPFHNNCLHTIAQFGLISFARELLNVHRANQSRVQVAMTQYNSDGLHPVHIMAARLDTELVSQVAAVNPEWLDTYTATGMNIIDVAVTCKDGLLSPRGCFDFICNIVRLRPTLLEQFLLAASNRYKHTGILARCDGALLAHVHPALSHHLF
jgi:hypothetical protein